MRSMRLVATVFSIAFWGTCFWLSGAPVHAQKIPALAQVPAGLPNETEARLNQRRQDLDKEYYRFKKAADGFTAKEAKQQSDAEYEALKAWRTRYIDSANAFNQEVANVSATGTPSNKGVGGRPVGDPTVRQEQDAFEKTNAAWMKHHKTLIQQRIESANRWCSAIYASLKTKEPPPSHKKFDELQPGDVLLLSPDQGYDPEALKSRAIRFADRLSSWEWESTASHTVLFIKEVNGKKLFLDNTSGMDGKTVTGVGPHIITGEEFLKIYGAREAHIAQPVSRVEGQKLWAAARELSLKELADEPKKSRNPIDKTDYGLYGDNNMVCSEASRWALIKAGQSIPETRSPFKKLLGVYFGPANFFSDEQHFIISPMEDSRRAKN